MPKLKIKAVEWVKEKTEKGVKVTEHIGNHVYRMHFESDPDDAKINDKLEKLKKEK